MKNTILIGIDPDVDKSGVAIHFAQNKLKLENTDYFTLFDDLLDYKFIAENSKTDLLVVIEKGELNKAIFTANKAKNKQISAKIGTSVGRNFEATNIIIKFCEHHEIDFETYKPTSKKWNSKFFESITGIKRSNQEQRDAYRCIVKYVK